jgi:hypothetical protein
MNSLAAIFAPLALTLPLFAGAVGDPSFGDSSISLTPLEPAESTQQAGQAPGWPSLDSAQAEPVANQVRIEQRVTIRVAPSSPAIRQDMLADLRQRQQAPMRFEERKMGKCVPVRSIAGVQADGGSRLIFYMRDQRMISANLEKACRARDFYSGFYVERSKDGMLCVDRDKLQSRSGANCEINRIRQLVAVRD